MIVYIESDAGGWLNCSFALRSSFNIILLFIGNKEFAKRFNALYLKLMKKINFPNRYIMKCVPK
jgi:hypothetical protein